MILWQPSSEQIQRANITALIQRVEQQEGESFKDFHSFYDWTIHHPEIFWGAVWDFCGIISSRPHACVLRDPHLMPGASWFPGARLNFAENLLRYQDGRTALVFWMRVFGDLKL